ncbi:hypothetical protein H671_1g2325 [Cricetulus griseus]|uniref:Uncharacterized protein n=1 Tax=Cricetulus griseus TaxID=10029 RepID=A0A061IQD5_CRIGR|nr:hypothetical protein H671_1g2325 [Cricetulus griseus]
MSGRPAVQPIASDSGSTPALILEERAAQRPEVGPDPAAWSKSSPAGRRRQGGLGSYRCYAIVPTKANNVMLTF